MSFMDKAKKAAEQAQQKLEEVQKQFNERQGAGAGPGPVPSEPASHAPQGGEENEAPAPPADAPNANPDPFKPLGS